MGNRGWFASGEQPSCGDREEWQADDDDDEVEPWDLGERMQVASVPGDQREVCGAGPEQSSEECEGACGGGGDGAPGGAGRSGCGERAEVVRGFAANEADGHGEYTEGDEEADRGGSVAQSRVRCLLLSSFDGDPGRGSSALG